MSLKISLFLKLCPKNFFLCEKAQVCMRVSIYTKGVQKKWDCDKNDGKRKQLHETNERTM